VNPFKKIQKMLVFGFFPVTKMTACNQNEYESEAGTGPFIRHSGIFIFKNVTNFQFFRLDHTQKHAHFS